MLYCITKVEVKFIPYIFDTHFFPKEVFQFPHGGFLMGGRDSKKREM